MLTLVLDPLLLWELPGSDGEGPLDLSEHGQLFWCRTGPVLEEHRRRVRVACTDKKIRHRCCQQPGAGIGNYAELCPLWRRIRAGKGQRALPSVGAELDPFLVRPTHLISTRMALVQLDIQRDGNDYSLI